MVDLARFIPIAHIVAAVFTVIELGLTAYLVTPFWRAPSALSFMLFNSVWTLLVLAYLALTPLYFPRIFHQLAALALEWVTAIFWFAGSIAVAAYWGEPYCGAGNWCGSASAAAAFGFFIWVIFTFLAVLDTMAVMRSRGHSTTAKPTVVV